jgi:hypothetical protein
MATLTTPKMALPYPNGAERVMDGDNAIGALANAIDAPLYRAEFPIGAVAYSAASSAVAANGRIPLETLLSPSIAATLVANALRIAVPGLYLVTFQGSSVAGALGSDARVTLKQAGTTRAGAAPSILPASSTRWSIASLMQCVVGDDLYVEAATAWSHQAFQISIVRLGASLGASLLDLPTALPRAAQAE